MTWRMAKSLEALREQLNTLAPNRSKASDGGIGNAEHSSRTSDHNPDDDGVVCARDFTHDPAHGVDSQKLAETLVASRDSRIKYIISNRRIISGPGGPSPWTWRPYGGTNPHNHHVHVSVTKAGRDDVRAWQISLSTAALNTSKPVEPDLPILRKGATGDDVKNLQALLLRHGAYDAPGVFGPVTEAAAKAFQKKRGLVDDGVIGRYTRDALNA